MLVLHCEEKVIKYKQSDKQFEMIRAKLNANAIESCLQHYSVDFYYIFFKDIQI